jgi:hypothetical protein
MESSGGHAYLLEKTKCLTKICSILIDEAKGKEEEEPYDVAYSGKEDES